jgi:transposase
MEVLRMAMGKRKARQEALFITADRLPRSGGHPFYKRLNALLAEFGFDRWIEDRCLRFYEQEKPCGRPSIPPGVYFRMLLVGYFEGIDSQRGIAWRCADSLSLREFLGVPLEESTPDHSSLTNIRQRLPEEIFAEVFQFVLRIAAEKKLLAGKTVGVDSTTLEANAAMKSIVRRESGEDWQQYVTRLMHEDAALEAQHSNDDHNEDADDNGPPAPTGDELRRFDKKRRKKRVSNDEWVSPSDEDSRIARMKDGRTRLAYKAEHVVDLESDMVLSATVTPADHADNQTMVDSVMQAQINLQAAGCETEIEEVAADKGYHANANLELSASLDLRTYIPEPARQHKSRWTNKPNDVQRAVLNNRCRTRRAKGKQLQRRRSEVCERSFAHVCDTGGARRTWLRGLANVGKRYLIAVAARNLGRILAKLFGIGKPRCLQGAAAAMLASFHSRGTTLLLQLAASSLGLTAKFGQSIQQKSNQPATHQYLAAQAA